MSVLSLLPGRLLRLLPLLPLLLVALFLRLSPSGAG